MQGLSIHPLPNRIPLWRGKGWGAEWAFTRKRVRLFRESWEKQRNRIPGSVRGKSRRGGGGLESDSFRDRRGGEEGVHYDD